MGKREGRKGVDHMGSELRKQFGKPDPTDWRQHYTPEAAEGYAAELASIEAQLDEHWPGWRERKSWAGEPSDKAAWIKLRLKRRDLILHGQGAWGVHIVWTGPRKDRPMAATVRPTAKAPGATKAYGVLVSVPLLARNLKLSVAQVEAALKAMPIDVRDAASWIPGHVAAGRGTASLPDPVPPPVSTGPTVSEGITVASEVE